MKNEFRQVIISATSKAEANKISDVLVKKKLIAGSLIVNGSARYWWDARIVERKYYNIQAFALRGSKPKIIYEVKRIHRDKCPIIAFIPIDGNSEFLKWIKESVG